MISYGISFVFDLVLGFFVFLNHKLREWWGYRIMVGR